VFAVKRYRPYLEDKPFLLRTDNKSLLWLNGAKDSNAKLTRWALLLQEFNFRVEHCPGKNNELPDVLSRQPEDDKVPDDAEDMDRMLVPDGEATIHPTTEPVCAIDVPTLLDEVRAAQLADPDFPGILERWRRIREAGPQQPGERSFAAVYDVIDGHLVKRDGQKVLLWVPETTRKRILNEFHDVPEAGHPGYEETLRSILSQYTSPTVSRDVRAYVKGLFNIRRRRNAATGQSPSHLLLGYDLRIPGQWEMDNGPLETTPEQRQEDALDHQRRYRRRYIRPGAPVPAFRPNDLVLVRHHTKRGFEPTWVGPVRVIADSRGNCYWIERGAYATREHIDHLRPAPAGHEGQQAGEQPPAEGPEPD
jgi:hypothetical protein